MTGLFSKIFGAKTKAPESIGDLASAGHALERLRAERDATRERIAELAQKRHDLLRADAAPEAFAALDSELDAANITLEKIDTLEPELVAKISQFQSAERAKEFEALTGELVAAEAALDAAMAACADATAAYLAVTQAFDARGFGDQARSIAVRPPLAAQGGVIADPGLLELWRRERERRDDMAARRPIRNPFAQPSVAPHFEPKRRMIETGRVTLPASGVVEPAAAKTRRPLKTVDGEIAFGFSKLVALRSGIEISGEQLIAGDEFIAATADAKALVESGAAEIVARGEIDNAAE